jgi:hypothetical protein
MNHTQIHDPAPPASTPQSHLTQLELARRWNKSVGTLERFRSEGIGPRFLKIGGTVRYRLEDIEAFERDCLYESVSSKSVRPEAGASSSALMAIAQASAQGARA